MAKKALTAIQRSAKGEDCTFNLHSCSHNPEQTVLCHDTRYVEGSERKHDLRATYGCLECHSLMDGNYMIKHKHGYEWGRAIAKTHVKLLDKGLITITGVEHKPSKILPRN